MLTKNEKIEDILLSNEIFKHLKIEQLETIIENAFLLKIKQGETLMNQGDYGDCMYIVISGKLSIWIKGQKRMYEVGESNVGDFIGELALLTQEHRNATIKAKTDAELLRISKESFNSIIDSNPLITKALYKKSVSYLKSNFSGWFVNRTVQEVPTFWKQTLMVLLIIFPIVALEVMFLNPVLKLFNPSIALFISCSLSVILVSVLMPIGIYFFDWWLYPQDNLFHTQIKGYLIVIISYIVEIIVFLLVDFQMN